MKHKSKKSVEPIVADLVNGWLKSYRLDYKLEQDSLNSQIDKALDEYFSKSGLTVSGLDNVQRGRTYFCNL